MFVIRLVFGLLLLAGLLCLGLAITTRDPRWQRRGVMVIRWTVIAGLGALAVVVGERLFAVF